MHLACYLVIMVPEERIRGEAAIASSRWAVEEGIGGEDDDPWVIEAMFQKYPELRHKHYVAGTASPFVFKGPKVSVVREGDGDVIKSAKAVWAVYVGEFGGNASRVVQGGAIASMFDLVMACFGSIIAEPGSFGLTKSLFVRYLKGASPVPGVYKITTNLVSLDEQKGLIVLRSALTDGSAQGEKRPFAVSDCKLVDLKRRIAYKNRSKL